MKKFALTPVAALVIALQPNAHAQSSSAPSLPTVEVPISPIIQGHAIDEHASLSTVVSAEQIKDLGALDLAAALRMSPGLQISRYNEVGSYSGDQGGNVYIRGLGTSRPGGEIKTYWDGTPLYMGLWNHPLMDLLPLNGIGSVVVHKGPQNQFAGNQFGAINLLSKKANTEGVTGEAQLSFGSNGTRSLQANLVGQSGATGYSLAAGHTTSNGTRPNADSDLTHAMGRVTHQINNHWQAGVSFLVVDNEVGDPGDNRFAISNTAIGPYSFSNGVGRNTTTTQMVTAFLNHDHGNHKGALQVFHNQGTNNLLNDANWGTFNSTFKMVGFKWDETFAPWTNGKVHTSVEQTTVSGNISGPHVGAAVGTPFAFGTAGSASIPQFRVTSAFAGFSHGIPLSGGWLLEPSAGARFYNTNTYGSKAAPQAGVVLSKDGLTLYAQAIRGVLYPGAETYTLTRAIPMAFAANNGWDRLTPSLSTHTEVGVQWDATPSTHVDISLFKDKVQDRYTWSGFTPFATGTWSNQFPDYHVSGLEASLKQGLGSSWTAFAGLTLLRPSLSNLPYAPRTALSVGVNGQVGTYRLALDAQHQTEMFSLTQDRGTFNPNTVAGFTVANARVSRSVAGLGNRGEVYLSIHNLFDTQYAYNAGYPMPGRTIRVGLVSRF